MRWPCPSGHAQARGGVQPVGLALRWIRMLSGEPSSLGQPAVRRWGGARLLAGAGGRWWAATRAVEAFASWSLGRFGSALYGLMLPTAVRCCPLLPAACRRAGKPLVEPSNPATQHTTHRSARRQAPHRPPTPVANRRLLARSR